LHNSNDNRIDGNRDSAEGPELLINLPDEASTSQFAAQLAETISPGMVLYLRGELGAGKTTLVRALLNALGYQGRVKSPTYTLLEQYNVGGFSFCHFDLYRFQDAMEWETTGFNDEFNGENICLVEWPEQAAGLLPPADMEIFFEILPEGRKIKIYAKSNAGKACLSSLQK